MKKILSVLFSVSLLAGCGDDSNGESNDAQVGYLTLSGIRGLNYQTASQSGVTDTRGTFRYYPGETISFSLGDVVIAQDIVAKPFLSPADFDPAQAEFLNNGSVINGLTTHRPAEDEVAASARVANTTGFLLALDDDSNMLNGIFITDDLRSQIEQLKLDGPVDFTKTTVNFGQKEQTNAVENRFIWALCFPEHLPATCENPTAGRSIGSAVSTIRLLKGELDKMTGELGRNIFLTPYAEEVVAGDSSIRTVQINIRPDREIIGMEVISTDDAILRVQNFDPNARQFSYFPVGAADTYGTIIVNLKLAGDYRWLQKSLNVKIK